MGGREERRVSKVGHVFPGFICGMEGGRGTHLFQKAGAPSRFTQPSLSGSRNLSVPSPNSGLTSPGRLHYPLLFPVPHHTFINISSIRLSWNCPL